MQGSSKDGIPGKLKRTSGGGFGQLPITTAAPAAPQSGHQITGAIVVLSSSSLVLVVHVLEVISVTSSVETPVGILVIVEVIGATELVGVQLVGWPKLAERETVEVSILRIPDDPKDTTFVPLVRPEPPGTRVLVPITMSDPFTDAVTLGARVISAPKVV